jgi:hypothetical protein
MRTISVAAILLISISSANAVPIGTIEIEHICPKSNLRAFVNDLKQDYIIACPTAQVSGRATVVLLGSGSLILIRKRKA